MKGRGKVTAFSTVSVGLVVMAGVAALWLKHTWWLHNLLSGDTEEMLTAVKRLDDSKISGLFPILVVELADPEIESRLMIIHSGIRKVLRQLDKGELNRGDVEDAFRKEICKPGVTAEELAVDQQERLSGDPEFHRILVAISEDEEYPAAVHRAVVQALERIQAR